MATYGEIVYMVMDLLKVHSDDAFFTEEHVIFLANKFRALLLERKYRNARNQTYSEMSDQNMQTLCLDLEPADISPFGCGGMWLHSVKEVPDMINSFEPKISVISDMLQSTVSYVPTERMPYVGHNKWLRNIVYASISNNDHLFLTSSNPQFMYLKQVQLTAVFDNPEEAASLSCAGDADSGVCDILDKTFPLEDALIPSCIELIVQELKPPVYAPLDRENDARDGLSDVSAVSGRASAPAERMKEQETKDAAKIAQNAAKNNG